MGIKLPTGLCVECNDGKLKPVIGKRDKALCVNHYWNKQRAESKPVENKSDNQAENDKIYLAVRKVFLEDNKLCVAQQPGCWNAAKDVHHTKGREEYYLVVETWIPVCRRCHYWIEKNVAMAKELKLSQDRLSKGIIALPFNLKIHNSNEKLCHILNTTA